MFNSFIKFNHKLATYTLNYTYIHIYICDTQNITPFLVWTDLWEIKYPIFLSITLKTPTIESQQLQINIQSVKITVIIFISSPWYDTEIQFVLGPPLTEVGGPLALPWRDIVNLSLGGLNINRRYLTRVDNSDPVLWL